MRIYTLKKLNKGSLINRRIDFNINASVDKIISVATNPDSLHTVMMKVDSH
jgi:hypothetical protein